jgi:hypothetical protein
MGTATASAIRPDQNGVAAEHAFKVARPSALQSQKTNFHRQRVEDEQEEKRPSSLVKTLEVMKSSFLASSS